jgi:hypothetical protein
MKEINLSENKKALIDDDDYDLISQFKWFSSKNRNVFYAEKTDFIGSKKIKTKMHRLILNITNKKNQIDHIDGNGLNNKKNNLRICSHSTNLRNCKTPSTNTSGYKGVCWHNNRWEARMKVNGKIINFGNFNNKDKAIESIKKAFNDYFNVGA